MEKPDDDLIMSLEKAYTETGNVLLPRLTICPKTIATLTDEERRSSINRLEEAKSYIGENNMDSKKKLDITNYLTEVIELLSRGTVTDNEITLHIINKLMKIMSLVVQENTVEVIVESDVHKEECSTKEKPKAKNSRIRSKSTILKFAVKRAKDERIKKLIESTGMTFKEWLNKEYPEVNYSTVIHYLRIYKDLPLRKVCEMSKVKNDK